MLRCATLALALGLVAGAATAQERIPSHCVAIAQGPYAPDAVWRAGFRDPVAADTVRITFVDHSMFLLQTAGGLAAMTDFNGYYGNVDFIPDVVTMNNSHSTHFTSAPDPAIPHALRGWGTDGIPAEHDLDLGEMLVRNVTTNARSGAGVRVDGNSIFVFEVAGLCIGHLGHLHQVPSPLQYALLGRMDVVMVPVDGGLTLDIPTMIDIMDQLRARVVIPMHWFGRGALDQFLTGMTAEGFAVRRTGANDTVVSLATLPDTPTVLVLEPQVLRD